MYTTSGSKKEVEKSKIFLSSTLKEFDLEEVKGYKAQEKILQDYSTAFYKKRKNKSF